MPANFPKSPAAILLLLLALSACGGPHLNNPASFGAPTNLTCVPYAREVSGIALSGDAYEWWDEAAGLYPRSHAPEIGAVLVFAPHGSMNVGHLAVVTRVRDARTIEVTQSNWLPYRIEHNQPVIDVSPRSNWTQVRVWYEPAHEMGETIYPTYGFILPH
jgi:surface antigen